MLLISSQQIASSGDQYVLSQTSQLRVSSTRTQSTSEGLRNLHEKPFRYLSTLARLLAWQTQAEQPYTRRWHNALKSKSHSDPGGNSAQTHSWFQVVPDLPTQCHLSHLGPKMSCAVAC